MIVTTLRQRARRVLERCRDHHNSDFVRPEDAKKMANLHRESVLGNTKISTTWIRFLADDSSLEGPICERWAS